MAPSLARVVPVAECCEEGPRSQCRAPRSCQFRDERSDALPERTVAQNDLYWHDRWINGGLLFLAILENIMYYGLFLTVNGVDTRLHNIVEIQLIMLEWVLPGLLVFTIVGTLAFVVMLVLVEGKGLPLFQKTMHFRLHFSSMPCMFFGGVIFYHSESTKWAPFTALMFSVVFSLLWCVHMRFRWWHQLTTFSKVLLDISGFLAFVVGFTLALLLVLDRLDVLTRSGERNCPYTANVEMPVAVPVLGEWFCAPWCPSKRTLLSRAPRNAGSPRQLLCSDTFAGIFGESIDAYEFVCPSGCLRQYAGDGLFGCGVYSTDSQVCVAAIQSGALTDAGGIATVYGQLGVPRFQACSMHSVTSASRLVSAHSEAIVTLSERGSLFVGDGGRNVPAPLPVVVDAGGSKLPQAFHFSNLLFTEEYVWLEDWDLSDVDETGTHPNMPWTRLDATVSARVAGLELDAAHLRLGSREDLALVLGKQLSLTVRCQFGAYGVKCPGAPDLVVNLDFCQPHKGKCLS